MVRFDGSAPGFNQGSGVRELPLGGNEIGPYIRELDQIRVTQHRLTAPAEVAGSEL